MKNQVYTGTPTSRREALCPATVTAGMPVLLGKQPAVALDDCNALTGRATFLLNGTFTLPVVGTSSHSPYTGAGIKPGDPLYASGTLDATTNVTTGLLISATAGDTPFGCLDPSDVAIAPGSTSTTAEVKI